MAMYKPFNLQIIAINASVSSPKMTVSHKKQQLDNKSAGMTACTIIFKSFKQNERTHKSLSNTCVNDFRLILSGSLRPAGSCGSNMGWWYMG